MAAELGNFGSILRGAIEEGRRAFCHRVIMGELCRRLEVTVAPWGRPFFVLPIACLYLFPSHENSMVPWMLVQNFKPPCSRRSMPYLHSAKVPFLSQSLNPFPDVICPDPPHPYPLPISILLNKLPLTPPSPLHTKLHSRQPPVLAMVMSLPSLIYPRALQPLLLSQQRQ
jgi:hypothetical protein